MADVQHGTEPPKHLIMCSESPQGYQATEFKPLNVANGYPTSYQSCIPSFADASKLVSTPYSCLVMDTHRRHIGLAPMYMKKKRTGIEEELNTELLKYSESLKGVPLAYDDVTIMSPTGNICDDNGYIHMDISARFIVFNPQQGQKLRGVVNKLGVSHAGLLVHGCFNASVPKPNLISVDAWRDVGPRIGAELEFEVNHIDADQIGVVLILGRLERTKVQEMLAMAECMESVVPDDQPSLTDAEDPEETPRKKKKKKKTQEEEHATQTDVRGELGSIVKQEVEEEEEKEEGGWTQAQAAEDGPDSAPASERKQKKKKSKKDKGPKDEGQEVAVTGAREQHCSDSSGYLSDKPSRKRKLEAAAELTPSSKTHSQTPESKKKRKSNI